MCLFGVTASVIAPPLTVPVHHALLDKIRCQIVRIRHLRVDQMVERINTVPRCEPWPLPLAFIGWEIDIGGSGPVLKGHDLSQNASLLNNLMKFERVCKMPRCCTECLSSH